MSERPDRPVFCGNFEYEAEERDVWKLFEKYGPVERIDMKQGYAFVYMKYKEDGDDAVRKLDRTEWGYKRRMLRVEWAQHKESDLKRDTRPSRTLFVVNFDTRRTTERDVERYFSRYGSLLRVQIKKNYAFVQFPDVETASRALERTNGAQFEGRTLTVEFVQNEDPNIRVPDFGGRGGRGRSRSRSRDRGGRSPARYDRRPSPPRSRSPPRRGSPPRRSPSRSPPRRRASPPRARSHSRSPPPRRRSPSRSPPPRRSPPRGRSPSRSPPPRRASPARGRSPSRSPPRRGGSPPPRGGRGRSASRSRSPPRKADRSPSYDR